MTREFDDDALRTAYTTVRGTGDEHQPDCPSAEALQAALAGRESRKLGNFDAEYLATLDRALTCPACRREIALLHAFAESQARDEATRARRSPWKALVPMALAASILLVAGAIAVRTWGTQDLSDDVLRGGGAMSLVAPPNGASASPGSVTFTWRRVPNALRYTLELDASDGTVLYTTPTVDTTIVAPLAKIPPGEHRWLVRTKTDFGAELRSETRVLRVR